MNIKTFSFQPTKLIAVKKKIQKTFPTKADIYNIKSEKAKAVDLDELLKKIRDFNRDKIIYLADSLKESEITALAYNYSEIPAELYQKVNKIILHRKNEIFIKILWHNFADDYQNEDLKQLLGNILASFAKLNEKKNILAVIFNNALPLLNMQKYIKDKKISLFKFLNQVDLIFENRISKKLAAELFSKGSKDVFMRENEEDLIKIFTEFKSGDFKKAAENYLIVFKQEEYFEELMYKIKDQMGDPREDYSTAWKQIDNKAKEKAVGWFNLQVLKDFRDNIDVDDKEAEERFNYWVKYKNEAKPMLFIKKYKQLFLVFDKFAVIEFGNKGNAAYFYGIKFFNENLRRFMNKNNPQNNNDLKYYPKAKDKKIRNVERFRHIDGWQDTADKLVIDFKAGRR